jgi:hypothetical protein
VDSPFRANPLLRGLFPYSRGLLAEGPEDGVDDAVFEAGAPKRHEETVVFGMTTQLVSAAVVSDERLGRGLMKRESHRDTKFVGPFDEVMTSIGARVIMTPVRAPRANAYAEHFVRTVRTECLDWLLIRGERHLELVLGEFVEHYNPARPHRGIGLEVPVAYSAKKRFDGSAPIEKVDRLGGLLHEYRIAA